MRQGTGNSARSRPYLRSHAAQVTDAMGALPYFVLKYCFYFFWCRRGVRSLPAHWEISRERRGADELAACAALFRIIIGAVVGASLLIAIPLGIGLGQGQNLGLLLLLYPLLIGLRWLEWSLVSGVLRNTTMRFMLRVTSDADRSWRRGGVILSITTDFAGLFLTGAAGWIPC